MEHLERPFVRTFEPLTQQERAVGWAQPLCGGHLVTEDARLFGVPNMVVQAADAEFSFSESLIGDILSFMGVAATDGEMELANLWDGPFSPEREASPKRAGLRKVAARRIGRQRGQVTSRAMDRAPYRDPVLYRSAVVSHCREELRRRYPFLELSTLQCLVQRLLDPSDRTAPWPEIEASGAPANFTRTMDAAFIWAAPRHMTRRAAVIRAVEYLWFKSGGSTPLGNSRPFAIANLATGEDPSMGVLPWFVPKAIENELRAITHAMKKRAGWRTAFRDQVIDAPVFDTL